MAQRPNRAFIAAHLSDPGADSIEAFRHALAITAAADGGLVSFVTTEEDAAPEASFDRAQIPSNIELVPHQTEPDDLFEGVRGLRPALVVTATHRSSDLERLFQGSHTGRVSRQLSLPTLFLGVEDPGLLDETGKLGILRVLVPTREPEREARAIRGILELCRTLGLPQPEIVLLGVGDHAPPANEKPHGVDPFSIEWARYHALGEVAPTIAEFAVSHHADLVVMVTDGRDSLADGVRGTITERVIRASSRPVLALSNRD
ncbi:MAG: nucleotide-binding universal stress UspA family protein [Bradymonadia bacterium]|jgi:nucleotide-binding universal stress UspA family protein